MLIIVRPEVGLFVKEMERQLDANKHKSSWKLCDSKYLVGELQKNCAALDVLLNSSKIIPQRPAHILRRTANIANFAMMIADNWGWFGEGSK